MAFKTLRIKSSELETVCLSKIAGEIYFLWAWEVEEEQAMVVSFYYNYQNPLVYCLLVQIRAFVIQTSLGLPNLNVKEKRNEFWF